MSTKTFLKKVAVVAAMSLTLGGFTAVSASAAINTVTSSNLTATVTNLATASTTVCFDGSNNEVASFTVSAPAAVGSFASWSVVNVANPGLVFNAINGTSSTAVPGSFTATKSNSSTQCFQLTASTTLAAATNTVVITETVTSTPVLTLTVSGTVSSSSNRPWKAIVTAPDTTVATNPAAITVANVVTVPTDFTVLRADSDTITKLGGGDFRYVEITSTPAGATVKQTATAVGSSAMTTLGTTQVLMPLDGQILNNEIHVNTATAGQVVTVTFKDQGFNPITGLPEVTTLQTITITTAAAPALDPAKSTSVLRANSPKLNATDGVASSCQISTTQPCTNTWLDTPTEADETVIASRTVNGVSVGSDAVASIKVRLLDSSSTPVQGTLPAVGASVEGSGLVTISATAYGSTLTGSAGRNVSFTTAPFAEFYINIFADGNAGKSTISINVGGGLWKTETLNFYGPATTVKATQGLFVLPTGTLATSTNGCVGLPCNGTTVLLSVASTLVVSDALGTPVPYSTLTATTSDAGVLSAVTTATLGGANVAHLGVHHFRVTVPYLATASSGKSAAMTYVRGTGATAINSNPLTFALGGAAATVSISFTGATNVGALNAITVDTKDAAGNKAFDEDHLALLTSNVVVNTAVNSPGQIFVSPGAPVVVKNGTGSVQFFNPIVPTTLIIGGTVGGATVSATTTVNNAALDAALDAAQEATDAANAATDAANAAAEAADAATAAAQDAADAVAALSVQVATLIAGLQAQIAAQKAAITALTNLIIKIQKKLRA